MPATTAVYTNQDSHRFEVKQQSIVTLKSLHKVEQSSNNRNGARAMSKAIGITDAGGDDSKSPFPY